MASFTKNLAASLSGIKPKDLIYPGIVHFFMIVVAVLFFLSTEFITKSINSAFSGDSGSESSPLNMANYTLVAKKLGISTEKEANIIDVSSTPTTTDLPLEIEAPEVLDKKSITISILNSTPKSGVATSLSKALELAGFAMATTGNEKKKYATTTIIIKESQTAFGPSILEEVKKIYPYAVATTTSERAPFDVTIIIGAK